MPIYSVPSQDEELFRVFWNSGFHSDEELWPGETRAVCVCYGETFTEIRKFKNIPTEEHAEELIIEHLMLYGTKRKFKIKLFINYSPCESCSSLLYDFLTTHDNFQIRLYVSALYNINRKSCEGHDHSKIPKNISKECEANLVCLKKSFKGKLKIKTFDKDVWAELTETLTFAATPPITDTVKFYYNRRLEFGRTREQEDEKMEDDFKLIK
ncbi:hypothetical protein FSP39_004948 [Pinctada imbricata]|uniref:CMP/dCMP-type deaminase domain-containing protein n=1 Tax=Pinctada imbricata TaxID=66713 RepID=A0AA88YCY6_PINIB|nr:hypothetical protein FSP39_003999 [Pinctada imbricata]KAK3096937.1 hypothetical protein FSP39_004948 [Pinctada imbricata]